MLKWLLGVGLLFVIAIGVGGYYLYSNLDVIFKEAIESYGSEAIGVAVTVDRVELNLEAGSARIYGLSVANPPGFQGPSALTLGEIAIDIDLDSLQDQSPVVLDEIRIESPVVFYELNAARKSNLDVLQENAARGGDSKAGGGDSGNAAPEMRLRIQQLRFADGRIEADTRAIGGIEIDAKLATAQLRNVGGQKGATGGEIGTIVVKELGRQTVLAVGRDQVDQLLKDQVGDKAAEAVEGLLNRIRL